MKEKTTETISVKIIVTNIQQNSAVVKTVDRLGGRRQMHYQQRTIISFQPERNFCQLGKYSVQDGSTIAQAGQAALIRCHQVNC